MPTPGRPPWRSGVLLVLLGIATAACDAVDRGETLVLDSTEVALDGAVHDIAIAGVGATDSIHPGTVRVRPGDAVRFSVADRRPHALTFIADSLTGPARTYLERTQQLRGPPLVNEGAAWIVVLDGAPPGRYPFYCRSHGATGAVVVVADD